MSFPSLLDLPEGVRHSIVAGRWIIICRLKIITAGDGIRIFIGDFDQTVGFIRTITETDRRR